MTPSAFQTRVKERLSDSGGVFTTTMIDNAVDDWVRDTWSEILRKVPHYYLKTASYIGITDAQDAANELYLIPTDMRAFAFLRRSDLSNTPTVEYVERAIVEDMRYIANWLPYNNPDAPVGSGETWSLYDPTQFILIPAPTATSFTYTMTYFRVHDNSSKIDVPEEFLTRAINEVAYMLALMDDDPVADKLLKLVQLSRGQSDQISPNNEASVVPRVRIW